MPTETTTIDQALALAGPLGVERLDAQLLLLHALDVPPEQAHARRSWLIAHGDDPLAAEIQTRFSRLLERRAAGEPYAYLCGQREFHGLELRVDTRVLIPRPDTETLVGFALEHMGPEDAVLDLGTGSGAIALALKHARPASRVDAVDRSADALAVARANAGRLRLDIGWLHGSWFEPVTGRYALIVSNPPYIATGDPHLPALAHEPITALVSGADGLDDLRQIVRLAPLHLKPGGWLLLEHGHDQGEAVRGLLAHHGFSAVQTRRDLAGRERCTGGRWPGA